MIDENEKEIVIQLAKKYEVSTVYLFGSSLNQNQYHDIDLAVQGVKPERFFEFFGELIRDLPKPVDLIDLSKRNLFTKLIKKNGLKIYG